MGVAFGGILAPYQIYKSLKVGGAIQHGSDD